MKQCVLFLFFIFSIQTLKSHSYSINYESATTIFSCVPSQFLKENRSSDSIKIYLKSISKEATAYTKENDYKNAFSTLAKLRKEAIKYKDTNYIALSYKKEGLYNKQQGAMSKSLQCYIESLRFYKKIEVSDKAAKVLRNIADIQNDFGLFSQAESSSVEGLVYLDEIEKPDKDTHAWLNNSLARSYKERGNFKKALERYNNALKTTQNDTFKKSIIQNIALVYSSAGSFKKSIQLLDSLKHTISFDEEPLFYAKVISNLSNVKLLSGSKDTSIETGFLKALQLRKSKNDLSGLFASYIHFTQFYFLKNPKKARFYANKAYDIAKTINSTDARLEALTFLVKLNEGSSSKSYSLKYLELNLTLKKEREMASELYAGYRYEKNKIEKENLTLVMDNSQKDLKISQSQTRNLLLLSGIIILTLVSVVIYYTQRQKAMQKIKISKLQERYNTETRLSKKIHDEVGNDIFYLMTQVEKDPVFLEKNGLKLLDGLQSVYSKARDISREYTSIDTGEGFPEELRELLNSFGNKEIKLVTKPLEPAFWTTVDKNTKSEIFRIVQELLTNMKKHSQASLAMISFIEVPQKLIIKYSDDGVGIAGKKPTLKSVENRIDALKGVLTLDEQSVEGFKLSIEIPI